jgi:hypothetical protein
MEKIIEATKMPIFDEHRLHTLQNMESTASDLFPTNAL